MSTAHSQTTPRTIAERIADLRESQYAALDAREDFTRLGMTGHAEECDTFILLIDADIARLERSA